MLGNTQIEQQDCSHATCKVSSYNGADGMNSCRCHSYGTLFFIHVFIPKEYACSFL